MEELKYLKNKIGQEFHLLLTYSKDIDGLIKTLHGEEQNMLDRYTKTFSREVNKINLGEDVENLIGDNLEELQKNIIGFLENKSKMTSNYWPILRVSTLVYATSIFDGFLQDLLTLLFQAYPQSIISSKQITHQKALEFNSIQELRNYLVNENVSEIAYKSIIDQLEEIKTKFKVKLEEDNSKHTDTLVEIYETRNIHVHNKGIVNTIYLGKVRNTYFKAGEHRTIDKDYLIDSIGTLLVSANQLMESAIKKVEKAALSEKNANC